MPEIKGYHCILCRVRLEYTADDCRFGGEWRMSCCADGVFCEIADVPSDNELCEEQEDGTEILTFRCLVPNDAALLEINIPCTVRDENGETSEETVTLYSMLP